MKRFNAVLTRVLKELIRDKRTLALMLIAPILILSLMNIVFDSNSETKVTIGIDDTVPSTLANNFPADKVEIKSYPKKTTIRDMIEKDDLTAFITLDNSAVKVTYENEDPGNTASIKAMIQNILTTSKIKEMSQALQKSAANAQPIAVQKLHIKNSYVYGGANSTFFDKIFPILIGFFIFFFVFLISGIALLKERTSGTLERLLATPIKRSEIVLGYLASYGLFAIVQTFVISLFSVYVLDLHIAGNLIWVIITNILIALTALSIGIFVSTFASSEFQMIQFIPLVVIPQIFFSGLISLDTMAPWARYLSYIFPLSYGGDALTAIMIKGQGWETIKFDLLILILFITGFTLLNITGLKKYRKV
ncbi:ABC transporter permease [Enterococcus xiangfangensis]|uniref:ABC transporter permease n=1 Tax=Enterococcus xiangfangensis TaxID=1296537 RepID=UPI003D17D124|nr:ABC transporter permease [Enterococcus asini]